MVSKFVLAVCILAIVDLSVSSDLSYYFHDTKWNLRKCTWTKCVPNPVCPNTSTLRVNASKCYRYIGYADDAKQIEKIKLKCCPSGNRRVCCGDEV